MLAIVGVLSVGGIMGYTTAMRKHQANEIVQAISMMAVAAKSANMGYGLATAQSYQVLIGEAQLPTGLTSFTAMRNWVSMKFTDSDMCYLVESYFSNDTNQSLFLKSGHYCVNKDATHQNYLAVFIKP